MQRLKDARAFHPDPLGAFDFHVARIDAELLAQGVQALDDVRLLEIEGRQVDGDLHLVAGRVPLGDLLDRGAHHPMAQGADQRGLFDKWDELRWRNRAQLRVVPAQQRFGRQAGAVDQIVLGLVQQMEVAASDALRHIVQQTEGALLVFVVGIAVDVPALLADQRLVDGGCGFARRIFGGAGAQVELDDAAEGRQVQRHIQVVQRRLQLRLYAVQVLDEGLAVAVVGEDGEARVGQVIHLRSACEQQGQPLARFTHHAVIDRRAEHADDLERLGGIRHVDVGQHAVLAGVVFGQLGEIPDQLVPVRHAAHGVDVADGAPQHDVRHHQRGQLDQLGLLGGVQGAWRGVDQAQRADGVAFGGQQRRAGIEADGGRSGDHRIVGEARIQQRVLDYHHAGLLDGVGAEGLVARHAARRAEARRRLEPLAVAVDQRDIRSGHAEHVGGQPRDGIEVLAGVGVQDPELLGRHDAFRLRIIQQNFRHDQASARADSTRSPAWFAAVELRRTKAPNLSVVRVTKARLRTLQMVKRMAMLTSFLLVSMRWPFRSRKR